jgi:hypothetical protein
MNLDFEKDLTEAQLEFIKTKPLETALSLPYDHLGEGTTQAILGENLENFKEDTLDLLRNIYPDDPDDFEDIKSGDFSYYVCWHRICLCIKEAQKTYGKLLSDLHPTTTNEVAIESAISDTNALEEIKKIASNYGLKVDRNSKHNWDAIDSKRINDNFVLSVIGSDQHRLRGAFAIILAYSYKGVMETFPYSDRGFD